MGKQRCSFASWTDSFSLVALERLESEDGIRGSKKEKKLNKPISLVSVKKKKRKKRKSHGHSSVYLKLEVTLQKL